MPLSPRRAMIAKVKIGQKQLGWDDDFYRDVLEGRYGKRSATKLADAELVDLLEHMKASGFRPVPPRGKRRGSARAPEMTAKINALWVSAWNVGVVRSPATEARAAFVKRLTGLDAPAWMDGDHAAKVIEALKSWLTREAEVDWTVHSDPRVCVVLSQWHRLGRLGVLRNPRKAALDEWLMGKVSPCQTSIEQLDKHQLDAAQNRLGEWLRREIEEGEAA